MLRFFKHISVDKNIKYDIDHNRSGMDKTEELRVLFQNHPR
jgi:hypothetical protein